MKSIIFGGSGFIGQHLINKLSEKYHNLDIENLGDNFQYCDVRNKINLNLKVNPNAVIYNLAALCTIPKYDEKEYYETNVQGAKNICNYARRNSIKVIVFASSIAPYGMHEEEKSESSMPMPTNEYGISKLVAEHIHRVWQAEKMNERILIILRPGIVFGKDEKGNLTRLYQSMSKGIFFYPGRKDTKKASIYVKDLVHIMIKMTNESKPGVSIFNCCYPKPHTIEEICETISKVTGIRKPCFVLPSWLLLSFANIILVISKIFTKSFMGIHPDRVNKLMTSTNIIGDKINTVYPFKYNLEEAFEDWFQDCNKEGLY